jgi:hypothetical protein
MRSRLLKIIAYEEIPMPQDKSGRHILGDANYIRLLERLVLSLTKDRDEFSTIEDDGETFVLYNVRETISRQREYRCEC